MLGDTRQLYRQSLVIRDTWHVTRDTSTVIYVIILSNGAGGLKSSTSLSVSDYNLHSTRMQVKLGTNFRQHIPILQTLDIYVWHWKIYTNGRCRLWSLDNFVIKYNVQCIYSIRKCNELEAGNARAEPRARLGGELLNSCEVSDICGYKIPPRMKPLVSATMWPTDNLHQLQLATVATRRVPH